MSQESVLIKSVEKLTFNVVQSADLILGVLVAECFLFSISARRAVMELLGGKR